MYPSLSLLFDLHPLSSLTHLPSMCIQAHHCHCKSFSCPPWLFSWLPMSLPPSCPFPGTVNPASTLPVPPSPSKCQQRHPLLVPGADVGGQSRWGEVGAGGCICTSNRDRSSAPTPRVSSTIVSTLVERSIAPGTSTSDWALCGLAGLNRARMPAENKAGNGSGSPSLCPCLVDVHPWVGGMPAGLGLSGCQAGAV